MIIFSPTNFLQKFRQSNFFTKELHCKLISRKFFEVGVNFRHYHSTTLCISSKNVVKSTHLEVNCTVCMMFSRNSFLVRVNVTSKISTLYCHCEMMRISCEYLQSLFFIKNFVIHIELCFHF